MKNNNVIIKRCLTECMKIFDIGGMSQKYAIHIFEVLKGHVYKVVDRISHITVGRDPKFFDVWIEFGVNRLLVIEFEELDLEGDYLFANVESLDVSKWIELIQVELFL